MYTLFVTIPTLTLRLSGPYYGRCTLLLLRLWYFVVSRKCLRTLPDLRFDFVFNGVAIPMYLRYPMDIAVLREIFIAEEYALVSVPEPKVIVDLGAHYGDTALYYHARFPLATIIAVEPNPENFDRLIKNTFNIPTIIPVQMAVGDDEGTIELYLTTSTLGHSTLARPDAVGTVLVPLITLPSLLRKYGFEYADLIKFDIEGAEFSVFAGVDTRSIAHAFVGEVHIDLQERGSVAIFERYFDGANIHTVPIAGEGRYLFSAVFED